jgi:hypothetical protein
MTAKQGMSDVRSEPSGYTVRHWFRLAGALLATLFWLAVFIATFMGFLVFPLGIIGLIILSYVAWQAFRLARRT